MRRPAGARFGFGGKLISFSKDSTALTLYHVPQNQDLAKKALDFERKLESTQLDNIIQEKIG